jgi:hypothetical protein
MRIVHMNRCTNGDDWRLISIVSENMLLSVPRIDSVRRSRRVALTLLRCLLFRKRCTDETACRLYHRFTEYCLCKGCKVFLSGFCRISYGNRGKSCFCSIYTPFVMKPST